MSEALRGHSRTYGTVALGIAFVLSAALAYGGYRYYALSELSAVTKAELSSAISELEGTLALSQEENRSLAEALYSEQQKNAQFQSQIEEIAGTVGVLDKLAKTDPELLQKYSKVYFLNEHYAPPKVRQIDADYVFNNKAKIHYIHAQVWPDLKDLFSAAKDDGIELLVISAYRSFSEQTGLKSSYSVTYGTGANSFSADQGYSEHQLGTTLDFTTATLGANFTNFEASEAYTWLTENAYKYGFVLSYPKNNAYYIFEPWHWRYVGKDLARKLHRDGTYFYDMDQREIDEYLIKLFD